MQSTSNAFSISSDPFVGVAGSGRCWVVQFGRREIATYTERNAALTCARRLLRDYRDGNSWLATLAVEARGS